MTGRLPGDDETQADTAAPRPPRPSGEADRAAGPSPGTMIAGRYRIEAYLAAGGMGQVYRAYDVELGVPLALKTIRPEIAADPASLRRFKQEVLLARSVTHPNVCRIFDLQRDDATGASFLTMEFLAGETLASRISREGAFAPAETLPLVRQLADALDAAHRAGIVHRDFKSPNVMLVPGEGEARAVITDFGLAVTRDAAGTIAEGEGGGLVGTPAYMSPEQAGGGPVGPASDLYALGVVLFEMCTGRLPFRGATPLETARAHLAQPPPSPRSLAGVEESWERAILRLLSKAPAERFASAGEVVRALEGRSEDSAGIPSSLPPEQDAFVGRTAELAAIAAELERKGPDAGRLLTVLGPGGTGKTRLAQRYGWESLGHWPGGVWFCDLSEAKSVESIATAVGGSLKVPPARGDAIAQLGNAIAGRGRCLLILDNFEQLVGHAADTVGAWLERAAEARFLVTSRERLQLPRERTFALEPLDPLTQGVDLFEVRAQGHRPGFAVDAANRARVEAIVRELDGLPLALELAASRLRMLSLEQLGARLQDRFSLLAGGRKGRHATLRATLDWSWDLLEPWERSAMAQVSVFEGGFTLEAAEAVVDASAFAEAPPILDVIQSLVDKSWLRPRVVRSAPRFEMYVTVHEYARSKLGAEGPAAEARHGAFYARLGSAASLDSLDRHGGAQSRAALQQELDNLMAACRRAVKRGDGGVAVAGYAAAAAVLELRGPFEASVRLGREVIALSPAPEGQERALLALGAAERLAGRLDAARELYEAALRASRAAGDRKAEGEVLDRLGVILLDRGRTEEARELHEAALAIFREAGDRRLEGIVLGNLGVLLMRQGRMDEALDRCRAALEIFREVGHRRFEGVALINLGSFVGGQGRTEEEREHYEAALAVLREVGHRRGEAIVLGNLGTIHRAQGRMDEARGCFEAALAILREVGDRNSEGHWLGNLGALELEQGRMKEGRERLEAGLAIQREIGDPRGEGVLLDQLGHLDAVEGRLEQGRDRLESALARLREIGDVDNLGSALANLGDLCLREGRLEESRAHLEAALASYREVGNRCGEAIAARSLAELHRRLGDADAARAELHESVAMLRELNERFELGTALCALGELEGARDADAARAALAEAESIAAALGAGALSELGRRIETLRRALAREPGDVSAL